MKHFTLVSDIALRMAGGDTVLPLGGRAAPEERGGGGPRPRRHRRVQEQAVLRHLVRPPRELIC